MKNQITAKLGNMRKAQDFVVYPPTTSGLIMIQSGKSIGQFDPATGKGVLNTKGQYFHHLNSFLGAVDYQFPQDVVDQAKAIYDNMKPKMVNGAINIMDM